MWCTLVQAGILEVRTWAIACASAVPFPVLIPSASADARAAALPVAAACMTRVVVVGIWEQGKQDLATLDQVIVTLQPHGWLMLHHAQPSHEEAAQLLSSTQYRQYCIRPLPLAWAIAWAAALTFPAPMAVATL